MILATGKERRRRRHDEEEQQEPSSLLQPRIGALHTIHGLI